MVRVVIRVVLWGVVLGFSWVWFRFLAVTRSELDSFVPGQKSVEVGCFRRAQFDRMCCSVPEL